MYTQTGTNKEKLELGLRWVGLDGHALNTPRPGPNQEPILSCSGAGHPCVLAEARMRSANATYTCAALLISGTCFVWGH